MQDLYSVDRLAERDELHAMVRRAQIERLFGWDEPQARNALIRQHAKAQERRFSGEPMTGFGDAL